MNAEALDIAVAFVVPCLPLVVAAGLLVGRLRRLSLAVAPWVPVTALVVLARLHGDVVELPWLLLGARVGVDTLGAPLLVLASVAWTLAGWHARHHLPPDRQPAFFLIWLLTWTGNSCAFLTLDAASFYAAYAMMTFAAYGLVVFNGRPRDRYAGRVYIIMAILGEAMIIAALFMLGGGFGNVALENAGAAVALLPEAHWVTWLFLGGFAVKMGIVPLHMWLALAHPQAPVPASAVLSGVILKAGLMGWLRFLPLGADGFQAAGITLVAAGLFTAFYGAAISLFQERPKTVLAYSSVSQMGLVGCAVGAALTFPSAAPGLMLVAVLFALHHGLAKAALFLSVDTARSHPVVMRLLMWIPAAVLCGAPLTSGALAKLLFKGAVPETWTWLNHGLLASSVATTLIMGRFLVLAWPRQAAQREGNPLPWLALVVAGMGLPWFIAYGLEPGVGLKPFEPAYLLDALWPVLAGGALVGGALRWWPVHVRPSLPEGDIITWFRRPAWLRLPSLPGRPGPWAPPRRIGAWLDGSERVLAQLGPALLIMLLGLGLLFAFTL